MSSKTYVPAGSVMPGTMTGAEKVMVVLSFHWSAAAVVAVHANAVATIAVATLRASVIIAAPP